MIIDHPALAADAPAESEAGTRVAALVAAGLILPILDGLDELPDAVRGSAITQINDALRPGEPLIVTSRTGPYADAIRASAGSTVTLRAAAVVELCPLDIAAVSEYLRADAGHAAASRWDPVVGRLGTTAPVGQALETPLMVGLARTIYNPRPGEHAGALRDPGELCDTALADRAAVERHLFDAFIPAAYRGRASAGHSGRWPTQKVEEWLVFIACHLEHTIGSPDLAWWQLQQALPPGVSGLAAGLAAWQSASRSPSARGSSSAWLRVPRQHSRLALRWASRQRGGGCRSRHAVRAGDPPSASLSPWLAWGSPLG